MQKRKTEGMPLAPRANTNATTATTNAAPADLRIRARHITRLNPSPLTLARLMLVTRKLLVGVARRPRQDPLRPAAG